MKLSELIEALKGAMDRHGDVKVKIDVQDLNRYLPILSINGTTDKKTGETTFYFFTGIDTEEAEKFLKGITHKMTDEQKVNIVKI